jgi:two-component system, OmpR family, sensor histidine kinase VicK
LTVTAPPSKSKEEDTRVFYGVETVINTVLGFLYETNNTIDACVDYTRPSLAIDILELKEAFINTKKRGVKLRYVTEITKDNISYCKQLLTMVDELRHLDGIKGNFYISETAYLAPATVHEKGKPASQIIYSNVKEIIEHQRYVFDSFWSRAILAERRIKEIEEGIESEFFEVINDNQKAGEILVELAKSVKKEALVYLPNDKSMVRIDKLGIIDYLIKASQNTGVSIRVICLLSDENSEIVKRISEKAPGIEIINGINSRYGIYIVDGERAFRAELREPKAEKFSDAIGFSVYSNRKNTIDFFKSVFELLWNERILNEQLKKVDKTQKEFINVAAHELRTPIVPILGLSELLYKQIKKKKDGEGIEQKQQHQILQEKKQLEKLDVIIRNAERLQRLTEDILDVTKIESQALKLRLDRVDLNYLVSNIIRDYIRSENRKLKANVQVRFEPHDKDTGIFVNADRGRLSQVISNLISNALKFTEEGSITVAIDKKINNDNSNNQVIVSVKDSGSGIDPEILPRLFTKFAAKSDEGTGLGLYISKSIIEAHGGRIWAENNNVDREGRRGATFHFTLPLTS